MCRPEAESYGRPIVLNVGVVGGALYYNAPHGDGKTQARATADHMGAHDGLADGDESSVLRALE
jgi:hypothetical protein